MLSRVWMPSGLVGFGGLPPNDTATAGAFVSLVSGVLSLVSASIRILLGEWLVLVFLWFFCGFLVFFLVFFFFFFFISEKHTV